MIPLSDLVWIDETGYHYADYPTFLNAEIENYKEIFGTDVYLGNDSDDLWNLAINAQAKYDTAVVGLKNYNQRSPATAIGVGLSNVVKINGIKRKVPTKSTVDLTITGTVGTVITNGIAKDILEQQWLLPASVTIPIAGEIVVTASALEFGAINAQANTITQIYTPTRGWQAVDNDNAATPGAVVESDSGLSARQSESVANPSLSVFDGTKGAVANITGVTRSKGYENDSGSTDGDGIPAHSISMVVEGGDSQEIADAIALHKTPGTGTFGDVAVTTYDEYGMPNIINFFRPTLMDVKVEITIDALTGYSSAYEDLIKAAIQAKINSLGIGDDVLITKLYVPANLPGTVAGETFDITSIEIAFVGDAFGTVNLPIAFDEVAQIDLADITVVTT